MQLPAIRSDAARRRWPSATNVSPGLVAVLVTALAIAAWSRYGPFLLASQQHWSVTPVNETIAFASDLLWLPILAITYRRDPGSRLWKLILLWSLASSTWVLGYVRSDLAWTLAQFFGPLSAVILLHLVLAFPTGRLRDPVDRTLLAIAYAIVLPLQLVNFLFYDPAWVGCTPATYCPANVLLVTRNDDVTSVITKLGLLSPIIAGVGIVEVIRHWRRASAVGRRALAPVAFGMPLSFAILGAWWAAPALNRDDIRVFMLENRIFDVPSFLTPILFIVGLARTRLARGNVADLAVQLAHGVPIGGLRDALARALRDPSLELAFPTADGTEGPQLVDEAGAAFTPPSGPDRVATRLERDGDLVAVLVHDASVDQEDPGLVDAVGAVARLALENERLAAQVRAQLAEVRASRQRIVEAGDAERRRIERDLHDGAQQRLVALAMRLEVAQGSADEASAILAEAADELRAAIAEVRDLARGVHPPILTEAGLAAAIESLAERLPFPVEIDVSPSRYPPAIELAAYFVVAEALTNAAKSSGATHASVASDAEGGVLRVRVADDGSGGADPARGTGLRGLTDRVGAIGGRLIVSSPAGGGTVVMAEIPIG